MDQPLQAHTFNEAKYYLMVTACSQCGSGPWQIDAKKTSNENPQLISTEVHCDHCGTKEIFTFNFPGATAGGGNSSDEINPTDTPSRMVDLSQWLGLFQMLVESATGSKDKVHTRRDGYRASLCLAEALKFYQDNELPPGTAFFSDESLSVFREHPEEFARQKLRDMQAKLPALPKMAQAVRKDTQTAKKKWWQFWKKL